MPTRGPKRSVFDVRVSRDNGMIVVCPKNELAAVRLRRLLRELEEGDDGDYEDEIPPPTDEEFPEDAA